MTFQTDTQTMAGAANSVDRINGDVQSELNRLLGVVQDTASVWKGDAQNSFQSLMERWNTDANNLRDALNSIAENLRANAGGFDDAESENVSAFAG